MATSIVAGKDFLVTNGATIPKGATVVTPLVVLFRNPNIYKNPGMFDPSRWENPTRDMVDSLTMFSVGPRRCIAESLARRELFTILGALLTGYNFSMEKEGTIGFIASLKPLGCQITATRAKTNTFSVGAN